MATPDLKTGIRVEHVLEKGSGRINEDCLLIKKNLFGVFDGASSLDNRTFSGRRTGGMIAAQTARDEFSKNHFSLYKLGIRANLAIRSKMMRQNLDMSRRLHLWSTSAAVARLRDDRLEWLRAGDAQIILLYEDQSHQVLSPCDDHDYETLTLLKANHFNPTHAFRQQVKKVRCRMNRTYGVLNGEDQALDFARTGSASLHNVKTILLFTDGLSMPTRTPLPKKSFQALVNAYQALGLEGLRNHIRFVESRDPGIRKYPRFKCHDDIAAIALHI